MWNIQLWFLFPRDAQLKFNCVLVCRTASGLVVFFFFIHFAVCRNLGHYRVFHCHLCGYFHSASTRYCLVVGWVGFCSDFDRMKFQFKFEFPFCVWNFTEWKALRREQKNNANDIYNESECLCHQANDQRHGKWWVVDLNFLLFVAKMIDTLQSVKW